MPAVKELKTADYHVLVWKIEENYSFFANQITLNHTESQELSYIVNDNRKLEWLAARFVQRQVVKDSLRKDNFGKPSLKNEKGFVSISHCTNFAAVVYSDKFEVGVDIEPINDKVLRIADKFLTENEQDLLKYEDRTESFIAAWCVKETVYKWFGKKDLSFKRNIQLRKLSVENKRAVVDFCKDQIQNELEVILEKIENIMLSFMFQK